MLSKAQCISKYFPSARLLVTDRISNSDSNNFVLQQLNIQTIQICYCLVLITIANCTHVVGEIIFLKSVVVPIIICFLVEFMLP